MVVFLVFCLVGLLLFRTGVLAKIPHLINLSSRAALCDAVTVQGMVTEADLALSKKEVRRINRAVLRHGSLFRKVNLLVDLTDKRGSRAIETSTSLEMVMKIEADADIVIQSWQETLCRKDFAPYVSRYLNKAALELTRCLDDPALKGRPITKLYI